jgi:hypothetical protein
VSRCNANFSARYKYRATRRASIDARARSEIALLPFALHPSPSPSRARALALARARPSPTLADPRRDRSIAARIAPRRPRARRAAPIDVARHAASDLAPLARRALSAAT